MSLYQTARAGLYHLDDCNCTTKKGVTCTCPVGDASLAIDKMHDLLKRAEGVANALGDFKLANDIRAAL